MQNLLAKYGEITPLRPEEEEAFRGLAGSRREYLPGTTLIAGELDAPDQLFIVDEGRLFASMELSSGARAITRLYFEGDIIGTANIPFECATHTVTVSEPAQVYTFPRSNLVEAFARMPRIAAIFYTFAAMENAILNDRLCSIGRLEGKERLASLFLEIASRQDLIGAARKGSLKIGLTQAQMGDAIGLSEVQINRLLREMSREKLIERESGSTYAIDEERLCQFARFHDRYQDLDLDWFKDEIPA